MPPRRAPPDVRREGRWRVIRRPPQRERPAEERPQLWGARGALRTHQSSVRAARWAEAAPPVPQARRPLATNPTLVQSCPAVPASEAARSLGGILAEDALPDHG